MNNPSWLWLLPLSLLPFASPGMSLPAHKQSHIPLDGELNREAAQELMTERLRELREMHRLQDHVQNMLQDRSLLESIQKKFSPQQLQNLRDKILKGGGLRRDESWEKILQEAYQRKKLDDQDIGMLNRMAEKGISTHGASGMNRSETEEQRSKPPTDPIISPSSPSSSSSESDGSWWEQTKEWISDNAGELAGDVAAALAEAKNKDEAAPLAELFRRMKNTDLSQMELSEQVREWADRMPNLGRFLREQQGLLNDARSLMRDSPASSLPPAAPPAPTESGDVNGAMMALLALGVLYILVWRTVASANRWREAAGQALVRRPTRAALFGVATREDLVRVFERVALFRLGSAADACHHRELARRLAEHDDGSDAARRQQAAELLAWRYEQARYDHLAEPLSMEEWAEVRHALGFLAGVTAA